MKEEMSSPPDISVRPNISPMINVDYTVLYVKAGASSENSYDISITMSDL